MSKVQNALKKYGLLFATAISFVLFLSHNQHVFRSDYSSEIENYQEKFRKKIDNLDRFLAYKKKHFSDKNISILNREDLEENSFFLHIYRNDSLLFWNTNQLPVSRFSDFHYPSEGIVHLQNGWYFAKILRVKNVQMVGSFLIKKDYPYENLHLKNTYNPELILPFRANIILEKDNAYPIYSKDKKLLFAWYVLPNQTISSLDSDLLFCSFLLFFSVAFFTLYKFQKRLNRPLFWGLISTVILARYASIKWHWFVFLKGITAFDPTLFSNSEWAPNFAEFIVHCVTVFWLIFAIINYIKRFNVRFITKWQGILLLIFAILYSFFLGEVYRGLIQNSNIPLKIENLFELNFYSFLTFVSMGLLFFAYVQFLRNTLLLLIEQGTQKTTVFLFWLGATLGCILLDMTFGNQQILLLLLLSLISLLIIYFTFRQGEKIAFGYGVFLLFLFSFFIALNLEVFHTKKENIERELLAKRMASDQDLTSEIEFLSLSKKIDEENYLKYILEQKNRLGISEFKENMERRFFNGFWERYDIEFYLYDNSKNSLINYNEIQSNNFEKLEVIINRHSLPSQMDGRMFYIKDYTSQYSYIIRMDIKNSEEKIMGTLYCALKSKKIPEKIGFPRLLVSGEANVIEPLEKYSIAKYYDGKLVSHNGKFSYPSNDFGLTNNTPIRDGYFDNGGYNHYLLRKNYLDLIVLSLPKTSTLHWFTSCSYLFSFFGLFLLIPLSIRRRKELFYFRQFSLAIRIQIVLIGLVFVTLLVFGLGSGSFVTNQYKEYTNDMIKEKIRSLERDMKQKYGSKTDLTIEQNGDALEYVLQKLASVFLTDINMYDQQGFLLASSRPKIFNIGLLSEQINPKALFELNQFRKSEYIHEETIGNLQFLSAYLPLYNNEGNLLAFINLQHFGQQQGFEFQIKQFLEAIMNVSILLLALSVLFALFVSTWVTSPLRALRQSFSNLQLGKYNKPVHYGAKDEIGALVEDYNTKLKELATTTQKLAQSERESAWREMAKQVAHEIKNPLTPMKLSLQQLQRIYDPEQPISKEQLNRVTLSLIEQIDALAKIAGEFSNFAKLPKANEQSLDLVSLLENVITVFRQQDKVQITFEKEQSEAYISGDKDLLLRVFNNLITNSIQSIPQDKNGEMNIRLQSKEDTWLIAIEDNGTGISDEAQASIFVPYFTTKTTGTGLGLAMTKQIIEQHRGEIWFETKQGTGTTFFVELKCLSSSLIE
ncbi:MAG: ATP-binding protein [Crocinitomicaceae bacterium]|jgi:two-component system nitrogen regulation sensor histidine kinase NtrY